METPGNQPHYENQASSSSVVVVMVPFPAQSHLNQLLQLAHVVSSYGIPVHFVSSALHNSQVKSRATNPLHNVTKIHFHDIQIPFSPSHPPNPSSKTKFPEHVIPCFAASIRLRQPIATLLQSLFLTARRLVVIYDSLMTSVVPDVFSLPNAEAYSFLSSSAFASLAFMCEALGRNDIIPIKDLPSSESCFPSVVLDFLTSQIEVVMKSNFVAGELCNSCRAIEGSFLELITNDNVGGDKKMWAVAPLHKTTIFGDRDKCLILEWLDKQEPNTVLYISFGKTVTFSNEEIKELALGLEQSGVKFIWVLRDAYEIDVFSSEKEDGRSQLPKGFEERVKEMGIVVREWVPQVEILGHPSIGGFMSHCGWNSCVESLSRGVPIAAWPMHSDQPMNALLITEVLKVGVAVMEWCQREELVTSSMISRAVKKLMASDEGDEIRKRVVDMGEAVKRSVVEGGDCRLEWDTFISHITR